MNQEQYWKKILFGIILLVLLLIIIGFFLANLYIEKETPIESDYNTNSIISSTSGTLATVKNNLFEINIIDKDINTLKESIFVPIPENKRNTELFLEEYDKYFSIVDGIELNISALFRYERTSIKTVCADILNIQLENLNNNEYVKDVSHSELKTKNNNGYYIIDFKEKMENGSFNNAQKYLFFKTTKDPNLYIKYEFSLHPDLKTDKTELLFEEILTYLNI